MLGGVNQHVFLEDGAVHHAGSMCPAEGDQQAAPHPGRVARVEVVHLGERHESVEPFQDIDDPASPTGVLMGEGVEQFRRVRTEPGIPVGPQLSQRLGLRGHHVVVTRAARNFEEPVALPEQVGDVAAEAAPLRIEPGKPGERIRGGHFSRSAHGIRMDQFHELPVRVGLAPVSGDERVETGGLVDERDRVLKPHRTSSSRVGRSKAGCSSFASPAR